MIACHKGVAVGAHIFYCQMQRSSLIPPLTLPTHLDKQQGDMTESRTGNRQIPFDIREELSSYPYHIVFAPSLLKCFLTTLFRTDAMGMHSQHRHDPPEMRRQPSSLCMEQDESCSILVMEIYSYTSLISKTPSIFAF